MGKVSAYQRRKAEAEKWQEKYEVLRNQLSYLKKVANTKRYLVPVTELREMLLNIHIPEGDE
jgi:hypothetical protein